MSERIEIRDPIHVFVRLAGSERRIIDTPPFQRLRDIHQLSMTHLVYPGAIAGYGPRLLPTDAAERQLLDKWPRTVALYEPQLRFVAEHFGAKGVGELERLATALWVRRDIPEATLEHQARTLTAIKPHLTLDSAADALATVKEWEAEAEDLRRLRGRTRPRPR